MPTEAELRLKLKNLESKAKNCARVWRATERTIHSGTGLKQKELLELLKKSHAYEKMQMGFLKRASQVSKQIKGKKTKTRKRRAV